MIESELPSSSPMTAVAGKTHGLKYRQLRSQLLGEIAIGRFRPGDILPSENELATTMRVSRTTVRQTLGELEREGLVRRVQGKGTFVAERTGEEAVSRTTSFALIVPNVATGYYPTLVSGFEHAANESGRPIIVCNTNNEVDKQASQLMRLIDQRVAGVLLNPSTQAITPSFQVRLVQDAGIPVVLLHRGVPDVLAPVLELPTQEMGRRAGRLMLDAGHRKVAFLASQRYGASESMEAGLRKAFAEAGVEIPAEWIDYGPMKTFTAEDFQAYEQYLEQLLGRLLKETNRPTALFVSFETTAEIIYLIAGRMGLRVPEDLSIVCFGGTQREGAIMRRLTAITVDEAAAAKQAVDLLVEMQRGSRPIRSQLSLAMQLGMHRGQTLNQLS